MGSRARAEPELSKLGIAPEAVGDGAKPGLRMGGNWECDRAKDGGAAEQKGRPIGRRVI